MMPERWRDIEDDFASSKRHFLAAVMLFRGHKTALTFDDSYTEVMAFQHAMQAGYTSFEVGLRRAFAMIGEALPQGPDWHAVLLRRAASALENGRPAMIEPAFATCAEELLWFRHVAMHTYDRFNSRKAEIAVEAAETFLALVDAELARLRRAIDPD